MRLKRETSFLFRVGFLGIAALVAVLPGCGGLSRTIDESSGRTVAYMPGLPNFDMEAISTLRGNKTGFDLYVGLPRASLVFVKRGEGYVAHFEGTVQLLDAEGKLVMFEHAWQDTLVVETFEETQAYEPILFERRIAVDPGDYVIRCGIQDVSSQKSAVRVQRLTVFSLEEEQAGLSRIRVEGKVGDTPFAPIVALHVPADTDSIRALVELYDAPPGVPTNIEMTLRRFRADDEVASLPYWISPMMGSLGYRGVDYRRSEVIQRSTRRLNDPGDELLIEFLLPQLDPGVYRIEVKITAGEGGADEAIVLQQERELSVKSFGFPRVSGIDQLVEALVYIARDKEVGEIRDAPTGEEKLKRFDAFWGGLVSNRQVASNLLRQYYGRIEEANLLFTSHKEGWKTDRGMVYVVLGAPFYVEYQFDTEIWYYSYSDRDPMQTFVFRRVRAVKGEETFQNYILTRRPYYERTWTRALNRWRDGSIL